MRVRDYLKEVEGDVTFIEVIPLKLKGSPFYNNVYSTTPIRQKWEWEKMTDDFLDRIVVRKNCEPIDVTGVWSLKYKQGLLNCCIVESEETFNIIYSEKQANEMIEYYERTVK